MHPVFLFLRVYRLTLSLGVSPQTLADPPRKAVVGNHSVLDGGGLCIERNRGDD